MSRILFDARSLAETGGVSRVASRVLAHLRATHSQDEIVTMTTGVHRPEPSDLHLRIPNKLWSLACLLRLTSLDRVATWTSGVQFDELILPNIGFIGVPKIPYTVVVHDLSFLIEPTWFPFGMRVWHSAVGASHLIQNATNVWCVSKTTARDVERLLGVPRDRIIVLSPDVIVGATTGRPESGRASHAPTTHARYILAFDGNARKNIATAIDAVARVREDGRFHDLRLIIVGHGPDDTPDWVEYHPQITDADLEGLYANASALLYPSWYEGFGLPLHEAARFNVPILASIHGALPETAPSGSILINPAKPHLWISALRNVLELRST